MTPQQEKEIKMFGATVADMNEAIRNIRPYSSLEMSIMSMLSDCQELLEFRGQEENIRQALNRAKYYVDTLKRRNDGQEVRLACNNSVVL